VQARQLALARISSEILVLFFYFYGIFLSSKKVQARRLALARISSEIPL